MKNILYLSIIFILSSCNILKNKSKSKSQVNKVSTFQDLSTFNKVDSSTINMLEKETTFTITPGVEINNEVSTNKFSLAEYQLLDSSFKMLNNSTKELHLAIDSTHQKFYVKIKVPPSKTITSKSKLVQKQNAIKYVQQNNIKSKKQTNAQQTHTQTKPHTITIFIIIASLFIAIYLFLYFK